VRFVTCTGTHLTICRRASRIICSLLSASRLGPEHWALLPSKVKIRVARTLRLEVLLYAPEGLTELLALNWITLNDTY
jgi:hypothetical protein